MSVNPATSLNIALDVNNLTVSWTNSTTVGALHTVYRSRGACGAFVPVAEGILSPYVDFNVSSGEVYAYYVVATSNGSTSADSKIVKLQFVGGIDQYQASRTSQDTRSEQKAMAIVYSGETPSGCGEFQRLQKLRGKSYLCGK